MRTCLVAVVAVVAVALVGSTVSAAATASRGIVVKVGYKRAFTAAKLPPGTRVTCVHNGHTLAVKVPPKAVSVGTVWAIGQHFILSVDAEAKGRHVVSCEHGGVHWRVSVTA
jgi:hypothetical protein